METRRVNLKALCALFEIIIGITFNVFLQSIPIDFAGWMGLFLRWMRAFFSAKEGSHGDLKALCGLKNRQFFLLFNGQHTLTKVERVAHEPHPE